MLEGTSSRNSSNSETNLGVEFELGEDVSTTGDDDIPQGRGGLRIPEWVEGLGRGVLRLGAQCVRGNAEEKEETNLEEEEEEEGDGGRSSW